MTIYSITKSFLKNKEEVKKKIATQTNSYYEAIPAQTMKFVAVASAVLLFLGILSIVLAHKDEAPSASRFGMAFTLDDALKAGAKTEKRVSNTALYGIPGEVTSASSDRDTASISQDATTTVDPVEETTTVKADEKDSPAEGSIVLGASTNVGGPSDDEDKTDDNDQRIVFIERLMGLHLSTPQSGDQSQDGSAPGQNQSQDPSLDGPSKGIKWASRTRKFSFPINSGPDAMNQAVPEAQPHPMLRYAAAAMMSRLIAAAARSQMEAQAREAIMSRMSGPKDKDDDAEDESVPVLLASLRDDRVASPFSRQSPPMYGRPMPRSMVRGPPRPSMSSVNHRVIAPPQEVHPLMQQLQALQSIQAIQRMQQRQREGRTSEDGPAPGRGQPALVMVAIPIQGQESRQQMSPPLAHPAASPYAHPYGHPVVSQYPRSYSPYPTYAHRPIPHPAAQTYAVPIHVPVPVPSTHYYHPSMEASHPHAAYYRPTAYSSHYPMHRSSAPLHPAYSQMRPVIEVPVEVPVPVHVPVPVAYPAMHPGMVRQPVHPSSRMDPSEQESSDQDQIVLFYDAELHDDNREDNNGAEDLQSSASEHRNLPREPVFVNPGRQQAIQNINRLRILRELAKHASQSDVRVFPISEEDIQTQQQHASQASIQQIRAQESQQQPAFIVVADDQAQPVERR